MPAYSLVMIIVAYVDNILFVGPNKSYILSRKQLFMAKWECCDLGNCQEFLCMHIKHRSKVILLDQCSYLDKVVEHFSIKNAKYVQIPLPTGYLPMPNKKEVNPQIRTQFQ